MATSEKKWEKNILLYKYFGLDPENKMTNISASNCQICIILGLLELSTLVPVKAKMVIYITNKLFSLSMSYKGQLNIEQKWGLRGI